MIARRTSRISETASPVHRKNRKLFAFSVYHRTTYIHRGPLTNIFSPFLSHWLSVLPTRECLSSHSHATARERERPLTKELLYVPVQLLWLGTRAGPGASDAHGVLVLDVGAQNLGGAAVLGLDIDVLEVEAVAGGRSAAVDGHRHVVPARARDVLPGDVRDPEAGRVAVVVRVW